MQDCQDQDSTELRGPQFVYLPCCPRCYPDRSVGPLSSQNSCNNCGQPNISFMRVKLKDSNQSTVPKSLTKSGGAKINKETYISMFGQNAWERLPNRLK